MGFDSSVFRQFYPCQWNGARFPKPGHGSSNLSRGTIIMTTELVTELTVSLRDSSRIEYYLQIYKFKNYSIHYVDGMHATITFEDSQDITAFILKGILDKASTNTAWYSPEPEFEFMVRLEKKLNSYNKHDEYIIRKALKDK